MLIYTTYITNLNFFRKNTLAIDNYSIMYQDLDDHVLLSLIGDKNKKAFQELYARYWDRVFAICINRVGNHVIAEDLVQDIFLSIWEHKKLKDIINIKAYLFQSVKFSVIKSMHKSSRVSLVDNDQIGILDQISELSIDEVLHSKLLEDLVFQEVERLPERTKIIFQYSRIDHLSSAEIADKLNISSRTVENQISHALKSLRKFLENLNSITFF